MQDKAISEGYQLTEVGVIPVDWKPYTLGELATFSGGSQPPRSTFIFTAKQGYLRLLQIRDYKTDNFLTYIPETLARKKCSKNDIMIGRYGPPIFQILRGLEGAYNVALIKATPLEELLYKEYLYYFLKQDKLFNLVESLSQRSSGQTGIDMNELKAYPFPLPPLNEQKRIAKVLSTIDELISALDELITKKRNIKQGTMQELLTGKTRLSGFTGEWEVKKFKDVTNLITCGLAATPEYVNESVGFPFLSSTNIKNGFIRWSDYKYIGKKLHSTLYKNNPPLKGDILYSRVGTIGEAAIIDVDFEFSIYVSLTLIKPKVTILNNQFLKHLLNSNPYKERAKNEVYLGGGVGNLNVEVVREYPIPLPPIEEQKAIAEILSKMDEEIEALEEKRDKYKGIKQGLMAELLTGKKRLNCDWE